MSGALSAVICTIYAPAGAVAPVLSNAVIPSAGTSITLTFSQSVTIGAGGDGGVTLSMSGGAVTATYSSGSGSTALVYTFSRTVNVGETGTVSYTQPGNGIESTSVGADVVTFSGSAVTNNSTAGATTPTLASATVPTAGTSITLTFSQSVSVGAGGSAGVALTMSGGATTATYSSGAPGTALVYTLSRTVKAGETGTIAYTQPGNGLEGTVGGLDVATFSGTSVTNNSTATGITAPTVLTTGTMNSSSGVDTYQSPAITPSANKLVIIDIFNFAGTNAQAGPPTSVSGGGITFSMASGSSISRADATGMNVSRWYGTTASPTTGVVTFNHTATNWRHAATFVISEYTGVDIGSANNGVVQSNVTEDITGAATSTTTTLGAFGSAGNVTIGCSAFAVAGTTLPTSTPDTGFSPVNADVQVIGFLSGAVSVAMSTQYRLANDTSVVSTWSASGGGIMSSVTELKAA